jgi:[acyl-carrier-protein] S-malonyltransferase
MGLDLWRESPAARSVYEIADLVLGFSLSEVCFNGPEERLRDTEYAQPAIFTTSLAALAAAVESGAVDSAPGYAVGHSLGEYTALVAAGAITLEDGLDLLRQRARLMAAASSENPGTMAAIIGLDEVAVRAICEEAGIDLCNLNLPSQTVVGGPADAVARAVTLAKERGAQRAIELNVSGAFHSRLMASASAGLRTAIDGASIETPRVNVVGNASAAVLADAAAVRSELASQVVSPVHWHESITLMAAAGVTTLIEFGPGRVLTGLAKRLIPTANLVNFGKMTEVLGSSEAPVRTQA